MASAMTRHSTIIEIWGNTQSNKFLKIISMFRCVELAKSYAHRIPVIKAMGDFEYVENLKELNVNHMASKLKASIICGVALFVDKKFVGGYNEAMSYFSEIYPLAGVEKIRKKKLSATDVFNLIDKKSNCEYIYFDMAVGACGTERLIVELFSDVYPTPCNTLKQICQRGEQNRGLQIADNENSIGLLSKIVPAGWIQFLALIEPCELLRLGTFIENHNRNGLLYVFSNRRHPYVFDFVITFKSQQWMKQDGTAVGKVIQGEKILKRLQAPSNCQMSQPLSLSVENYGYLGPEHKKVIPESCNVTNQQKQKLDKASQTDNWVELSELNTDLKNLKFEVNHEPSSLLTKTKNLESDAPPESNTGKGSGMDENNLTRNQSTAVRRERKRHTKKSKKN